LVHSRDRLSSSRLQGVAKHTVVAVAYDKRDLVGRRVAWARHDERFHRTGTQRMHPLVDDITLAYKRLELPADPGLALVS